MADSNTMTDEELLKLEKKIKREYKKAYASVVAKADDYFERYAERYEKEYLAYQNGDYTDAEFAQWVKNQVGRGERWERLKGDMANKISSTNQIASAYINDKTPSIYSLNYNYSAYEIEGLTGRSFDIVDEQTVRRLMQEEGNVTEFRTVRTNPVRDYEWNSKQIESALTSSILQGNSIKDLKDSFLGVMQRNNSSAIRNARTAFTSAQNAGRIDNLKRCEEMGIKVKKRWLTAGDGRVRDSHAHLNGQIRKVYEKFSNGLKYPADSSGAPAEVYNCRCTLEYILPEYEEAVSNESWDKWYKSKREG